MRTPCGAIGTFMVQDDASTSPCPMKHSLRSLALCAGVVAGIASHAQRLFDIGLKAGVGRDDLATDYAHSPVLGGSAGLFARVKAPLLPGAQGEVLLTTVGTHLNVEGYNKDLRTVALQVPLFAVLSIGPVELHAGGYYERYLTKNFINGGPVTIEGQEVSLDDLANDGYGALVGAGVHLARFYGGVRYNMGLGPLGNGLVLDDVHSRQLQLYIGFGFVGGAGL